MPHFQLVTVDGEALGPFEIEGDGHSTPAGWPIETVVYFGERGYLRVIDSVPAKNPEQFTVLLVEPDGSPWENVWLAPVGPDVGS